MFQPTQTGGSRDIQVTTANALNCASIWAAVRCRAQTIASFDCELLRTDAQGYKKKATDHPLFNVLQKQPNSETTAFTFWEFASASIDIHGNFLAEIVRNVAGQVIGLYQLRSDMVGSIRRVYNRELIAQGITHPSVTNNPNGTTIMYQYSYMGGTAVLFPWDVIHVVGFGSVDAIWAPSPVTQLAQTIALAMGAEAAAKEWFDNNCTPHIAILHPGVLGEQGVDYLQAYVKKQTEGGKPLVLEEDIKLQQFSINARDAQLIESRQYSRNDIAAAWGIPAHKIGGDAPDNTYANVEAQNLAFLTDSIGPYLERIEAELERKLFAGTDLEVEFNAECYLRGTTLTRYQAYSSALGNKPWRTPNDVRKEENLPPVDGGDELEKPQPQPQPQPTAPMAGQDKPQDKPQGRSIDPLPVITDTLRRLRTTKEHNAVSKLTTIEEVRSFYKGHADTLHKALAPCGFDSAILSAECRRITDQAFLAWIDKTDQPQDEDQAKAIIEAMGGNQ